jgi:hypothetical protein
VEESVDRVVVEPEDVRVVDVRALPLRPRRMRYRSPWTTFAPFFLAGRHAVLRGFGHHGVARRGDRDGRGAAKRLGRLSGCAAGVLVERLARSRISPAFRMSPSIRSSSKFTFRDRREERLRHEDVDVFVNGAGARALCAYCDTPCVT